MRGVDWVLIDENFLETPCNLPDLSVVLQEVVKTFGYGNASVRERLDELFIKYFSFFVQIYRT